jgi:hypothetical protein
MPVEKYLYSLVLLIETGCSVPSDEVSLSFHRQNAAHKHGKASALKMTQQKEFPDSSYIIL